MHSFVDSKMAHSARSCVLQRIKEFKSQSLSLASRDVTGGSFPDAAEAMLSSLDPVGFSLITAREQRDYLLGAFADGPTPGNVVFLCTALRRDSKLATCFTTYQQQIAAWILSQLLTTERLCQILVATIDVPEGAGHQSTTDHQQTLLVQCLVSIPDRIANTSRGNSAGLQGLLSSEKYLKILVMSFIKVLEVVHSRISENRDVSMQFLSTLLGSLDRAGHASGYYFDILTALLQSKCKSDFIWRRIAQRLICGVPALTLDGVLWEILARVRAPSGVNNLFGDSSQVITGKLKHFFVQKVLVSCCQGCRHSNPPVRLRIAINVLQYLAGSESLRPILLEALKDIIAVWSSKLSITKSAFSKHLQLSQLLLTGVKLLPDADKAEIRPYFLDSLLAGMEHHLASADPRVRQVGMTVGEELARVLDVGGVELKFDNGMDAESQTLRSSLLKPLDSFDSDLNCTVDKSLADLEQLFADQSLKTSPEEAISPKKGFSTAASLDPGQLDSDDDDDDLIPFDIPANSLNSVKSPVYIRDAMDDLFEQKDYAKFSAAFGALEGMIRRRAVGLDDIAMELLKIVLHLENQFADPAFETRRMLIMTAILQHRPTEGALYLSAEFYRPNYSIRQRLDMLDVICVSATALSMPRSEEVFKSENPPKTAPLGAASSSDAQQFPSASSIGFLRDMSTAPTPTCVSWRQIVQQRITTKSRQFGSKLAQQKGTKAKANNHFDQPSRFAAHCEPFFYPLVANINTARSMPELDMIGRDYFVFGRLVFTLATVLNCAQFCSPVVRMTRTLLEMVWLVRFHEQPFVRQSVLFGLSMVVISLPASVLVAEFCSDMEEIGAWLREDVIDKDPDDECRRLASLVSGVLSGKYSAGTKTMIEIV